jgi:hypothetical protein
LILFRNVTEDTFETAAGLVSLAVGICGAAIADAEHPASVSNATDDKMSFLIWRPTFPGFMS